MPYMGVLTDTLLVDGTDLQTVDGIIVTDLSGLLAPGTRRGDNVVIPNRRGVIPVPKVYDAYEFSIGIAVMPEDETGAESVGPQAKRVKMLSNLAALGTLLAGTDGDGLVTLTRRISSGASYVEHTCSGEFVDGLQVELLNESTGRTELSFINHDGCWFASAAPTVPIVP